MDTREYNRLLIRLLLIPLLALSLLALGLGYSLQRVRASAAWVDHSDRVRANVNRIVKLMVDEETGIRGFLLTRDPAFLEPYTRAERILPDEFQTTLNMVRDSPEQTARLQQIRQSYLQWNTLASQALNLPAVNIDEMRARKRQMDDIRAQGESFLTRGGASAPSTVGDRPRHGIGRQRVSVRADYPDRARNHMDDPAVLLQVP